MIKKITLLLLVLLSSTPTFVACSSTDDATEQTQTSYNINPPAWLQKKWILTGASSPNYTTIEFTTNDMRNSTTFDSDQS